MTVNNCMRLCIFCVKLGDSARETYNKLIKVFLNEVLHAEVFFGGIKKSRSRRQNKTRKQCVRARLHQHWQLTIQILANNLLYTV